MASAQAHGLKPVSKRGPSARASGVAPGSSQTAGGGRNPATGAGCLMSATERSSSSRAMPPITTRPRPSSIGR